MGEQDALRAGRRDVYQRADRKGAVADIDGLGFRNFGTIRKVGVPVPGRRQDRPWAHEDLEGRSVIEREAEVRTRFGEPESDQLPKFRRFFNCQIMDFGAIHVRVVELPFVVLEVTPAANRWMSGDG